ncbi:uncharacterized protein FPOAC1_013945 [Fusarium poae]|uniref:uncharacterized protein n=1 Tax=Fusarium poae TaxID=36050 RepID=UPI001D043B31|nr:uncharacterized protein FPOAC1_013945 [Fusarium poae]KAG8664238.1 hypothetical protein FPOAC1_013945 [Fusarium poae]
MAPDNIVRHWREAEHGTAETRWEDVMLQTWMGGRYVRYWIVRDDSDTSIMPDSADIMRRSAMEEIIASSEARLKEEDAIRLRKGDLEEDIDRDSSWVKRLRWVRHFGSRDLLSIHDAATWVRARAVTGNGAERGEQVIREQLLLGRLGQSFDREVDRCCWRLDSVPTETLQWLASITATSPSGVPFGKKGKEASMTKYRSVGHRYLSFCWRSCRIGRGEAFRRWAVQFTDEQWSLLHDVDEELEGDAFPSSRDSGFCSGRNVDTDDEDEEVGECEEELDDGGISSPDAFEDQLQDQGEVGVKAVLSFKEQHAVWMCVGSHTVISTIIGWMAYGKGHRQKMGGQPSIRWADDEEALFHMGEEVNIEKFTRTLRGQVTEAQKMLDRLEDHRQHGAARSRSVICKQSEEQLVRARAGKGDATDGNVDMGCSAESVEAAEG